MKDAVVKSNGKAVFSCCSARNSSASPEMPPLLSPRGGGGPVFFRTWALPPSGEQEGVFVISREAAYYFPPAGRPYFSAPADKNPVPLKQTPSYPPQPSKIFDKFIPNSCSAAGIPSKFIPNSCSAAGNPFVKIFYNLCARTARYSRAKCKSIGYTRFSRKLVKRRHINHYQSID